MQHTFHDRPPPLRRNYTDMPSPSLRSNHSAGEFTPEVSPLDDLIHRGRMLSKQIGSERSGSTAGLNPTSVQHSLRRAGSSPGPLERSRSTGFRGDGKGWNLFGGDGQAPEVKGGRQLAIPSPEERPTSSYPRFSMVSSSASDDGRSDRDSIMSTETSVRDSNFTLISGFLNPVRSPPNLQQIQGRHEIREQEVERTSITPVIVEQVQNERGWRETERPANETGLGGRSWLNDVPRGAIAQRRAPEEGPRGLGNRPPGPGNRPPGPGNRPPGPGNRPPGPSDRGRAPGGKQRGPGEQQWGRGRDEMSSQEAYSRSRSQPPLRNRRGPPGRQSPAEVPQQFPARKDSKDLTISPPPPIGIPGPHVPKYVPYRQDSSSSGAPSFGAPSRQGSAESERFPPPNRQGSGNSDRLLPRGQDSRATDRRYYPRSPQREGSNDSVAKYLPYRQGSGDAESRRRQGSVESLAQRPYSPQVTGTPRTVSPAQQTPNILPMISDMRTGSPDSIGAESNLTFGPSSASLAKNTPGQFGAGDDYDMARSASQSSFRSDATSIHSMGGTKLQKPTFNFSRPLSSRPSMETVKPSSSPEILQRALPEQQSPPLPGEQSLPNPVSMSGDPAGANEGPVPTYVYSRFALPRGRELERKSFISQDSGGYPGQAVYQQQPGPGSTTSTDTTFRPPSPTSPLATFLHPAPPPRNPNPQTPSRSLSATHPAPTSPLTGLLIPAVEASRGRSNSAATSPRTPQLAARSNSSQPHSATMSPDEHVQRGIDLHEAGSLQESSYHLRLAANADHPTGMLLFALACRHGWGMKANQKEGVRWLKRVTELASSEVADDEMAGGSVDYIEKKGRRAQFALSIYELGVSHMNGWGTVKDQALALRCFEIAGS